MNTSTFAWWFANLSPEPPTPVRILFNLEVQKKRKFIAEIISKINQNNFAKSDFDKLSKDKSLAIKKISLKSQSDNSTLKKEFLNQIYSYPEKKIIVAHDMSLDESYLVFIDKIEHATINVNSDEYKKYLNLSKSKITNGLFNIYDGYLKKKYKIDINNKALDTVENYFN